MDIRKLRELPNQYQQIALGLSIDEPSNDETLSGFVAPDEAKLRSMVARQALDMRKVKAESGEDFEESLDAGLPKWFDVYQQLIAAGWSWRIACYVAWAASPKINRLPKTQDGLARDVLGLNSDRRITEWRRKNPAIDELVGDLQAAPLLAHRADVIEALIQSASNHNYKNHQDRKLFLEMTNDYRPTTDVNLTADVEDEGDMNRVHEDEMRRKAALVRNALKGKNNPTVTEEPNA